MADAQLGQNAGPANPMRVAVEGCGHGTLDAIYSSIIKSSAVKGWDGVDLVIIGGDFQDLNVTAMPAKYRRMADFHQYYWGLKTAPFLTIFIGGNHEASNHLFELYYGGWVAPNIYYLGAANVVQVGSLKISGMSGIWKGYDYRKPHYERLPYSDEDMYSIYHVRELDVRKLLAVRSQVDIGISHDWPKGIEWLGDHSQLFKHKPHLREDAQSGKLGSTAAQKVMDHLRPPYWFSAHLHTKYAAFKRHDKDDDTKSFVNTAKPFVAAGASRDVTFRRGPDQKDLSAWHSFGARAREDELAEITKILDEQKARREEVERTGVPMLVPYKLQETFKKARIGNFSEHDMNDASMAENSNTPPTSKNHFSQLDGACASLPMKRRRESSSPPRTSDHRVPESLTVSGTQNGRTIPSAPNNVAAVNPDAIDIDMSDEDDLQPTTNNITVYEQEEQFPVPQYDATASTTDVEPLLSPEASALDSATPTITSILNPSISEPIITDDQHVDAPEVSEPAANGVSDEIRAQLAVLSNKFEEPIQVSAPLPHPEAITNVATKFLALSKCEDKQNFLQLLEIEPYSSTASDTVRPVKLQYVPEWLAILRVFAPELTLGGSSNAQTTKHKGDTFYRDRIIEEEEWVQKNIVDKNLLDVPRNFTTYASADDAAHNPTTEGPREFTNPQTTAFCHLIGIENPFDISEEERDSRMAAGLARESDTSADRGRGGRGHSGGRGGGRGGRGHHGGNHRGAPRGGRGHGGQFGGRGRGRGRG